MTIRQKYTLPLIAGLALAFCILQTYNYPTKVVLHSIVNIFAGGRSTAKVILFLIYIIFLSIIAVPAIYKKLTPIKVKTKWLSVSLASAFAYQLTLLFLYSQKLRIKITDFVITFNNNEVSSTMLFHNHLMKPLNGLILGLFGSPAQENIDTGWAFINLLPNYLYWIGAVIALVCAVLLIIKFVELYNTQEKWQGLFIIIYGIVSFSIIKNLIDGGILNREAPIMISALLFLIYGSGLISKWEGKVALKKLLLILSPAIAYYVILLSAYLLNFSIMKDIQYNAYMAILLSILITTLLYWYYQKKSTRLGKLLIVLLIVLLYSPLANEVNAYLNSKQTIGTDGAYVALYGTPVNSTDWEKMESINKLAIYKVTPKSDTTVREITSENNLLNNFGPVTIPWVSCLPSYPAETITFTLLTTKPMLADPNKYQFAYISHIEPLGQSKSFYKYNVSIHAKPCTPRVLNVIEELIKQRGQETFFILNLSTDDTRNN